VNDIEVNDEENGSQRESPDELGWVTDFQRIIRVARKLQTHPDARMERKSRMERKPPTRWLSQL
jgi:hypothetical protein